MDANDLRCDGDLLVAARSDPEAFAVFYRRHARGLLRFFRRRVATAEEAFDLTAETMAAALAGVPRYEPRPEPARVWLYGIAHNKLSEAFRSGRIADRARQALAMEPIELDEIGIDRLEGQAATPALDLLAVLPGEQQDAIRARHIDERDYAEIARDLRLSESVVRKRVSRGLRTMRSSLKEATDDQ
ncbi:MAG TPA: sigma-70 family RNA polymerase sigma factor [Solirubrobacteraceae bacterium]